MDIKQYRGLERGPWKKNVFLLNNSKFVKEGGGGGEQAPGPHPYICLWVPNRFYNLLTTLFGTYCPKGLDTNRTEIHARCLLLQLTLGL